MISFKKCVLPFLMFFFTISIFPQKSGNLEKWLKIKIFQSTREDVEKIYGKIDGKNHFVRYENSDGSVYVDYSKGECKSVISPMWNVREWTVIGVTYTPWKNPPRLKDLIPNRNKYKSRQAGDVANQIEYYDEKEEVSIIYDTASDEVRNIIIRPSKKNEHEFDCDLIDSKN